MVCNRIHSTYTPMHTSSNPSVTANNVERFKLYVFYLICFLNCKYTLKDLVLTENTDGLRVSNFSRKYKTFTNTTYRKAERKNDRMHIIKLFDWLVYAFMDFTWLHHLCEQTGYWNVAPVSFLFLHYSAIFPVNPKWWMSLSIYVKDSNLLKNF